MRFKVRGWRFVAVTLLTEITDQGTANGLAPAGDRWRDLGNGWGAAARRGQLCLHVRSKLHKLGACPGMTEERLCLSVREKIGKK